ncbi:MAG: hypothetical protein QOD72_1005 [Acidimicrobiaceae bacterium]|jgi:hypothetical protein|nr:hypothetical protein [Acidimicrobiaceae bacterium]
MNALNDLDAFELGELLEFLGDWLRHDPAAVLDTSLGRFTNEGYTLDELRADLNRFAFLLGAGGERFVLGDQS